MILDSGERREFDSGAVRDIQEGKGRCDLLPLQEVADLLADTIILSLANMVKAPSMNLVEDYARDCLFEFCRKRRWTLHEAILEVSKHFEEGAKKYGEWNWQKGIPTHSYLDSAIRHYLKWADGEDDEPHDRAFVWNLLCMLYTMHNKPEFDDLRRKDGEEENV